MVTKEIEGGREGGRNREAKMEKVWVVMEIK